MNSLPSELITAIYSYLDYKDILKLCQTNKQLNNLCEDPEFWKNLIYARFPESKIPENIHPREYFHSIFKFNVTINMIAIYTSSQSYQIEYKNIDRNELSCILDAFLSVLPNRNRRGLNLSSHYNVIVIKWLNNIANIHGEFFDQALIPIGQLRQKLNLPTNIVLQDSLISAALQYGYGINTGSSIIGFSQKELLSFFLKVLCDILGKGKINISQIISFGNSKYILERTFQIENGMKCIHLQISGLKLSQKDTDILSNLPF